MSRTSGIDFKFDKPIIVRSVVEALLDAGAQINDDGWLSFLLDNSVLFEWHRQPYGQLADILKRIGQATEPVTVGFVLFLDDHSAGGDMLFSADREMIIFSASINKRKIEGSETFADLGWYINKLVPILEPFGLCEITAKDYP
jgi:hypothetical protein